MCVKTAQGAQERDPEKRQAQGWARSQGGCLGPGRGGPEGSSLEAPSVQSAEKGGDGQSALGLGKATPQQQMGQTGPHPAALLVGCVDRLQSAQASDVEGQKATRVLRPPRPRNVGGGHFAPAHSVSSCLSCHLGSCQPLPTQTPWIFSQAPWASDGLGPRLWGGERGRSSASSAMPSYIRTKLIINKYTESR